MTTNFSFVFVRFCFVSFISFFFIMSRFVSFPTDINDINMDGWDLFSHKKVIQMMFAEDNQNLPSCFSAHYFQYNNSTCFFRPPPTEQSMIVNRPLYYIYLICGRNPAGEPTAERKFGHSKWPKKLTTIYCFAWPP